MKRTPTGDTMSDDAIRFEEIMAEIKELAHEALNLTPRDEQSRARAYWYAHIVSSIDKDHEYMGSSMCSMDDTLNTLNTMRGSDTPHIEDLGTCDSCGNASLVDEGRYGKTKCCDSDFTVMGDEVERYQRAANEAADANDDRPDGPVFPPTFPTNIAS